MTQPANDAGIAIVGPLPASSGNWRLPARLHLSAPLPFGDDCFRSTRLRARLASRPESENTQLPFPSPTAPPPLIPHGHPPPSNARAHLPGRNLILHTHDPHG